MKKKNEQMEKMTLEMIKFLQKWGLWRDVSIFANGNRYSYSSDKEKKYKGIPNVSFEPDVDPEETMKGLTEDENGKLIWKSFANPEHIFDMVYEGSLSLLLRYGDYEPNQRDISLDGWDYIFEHTDLLTDYLLDKFGASSLQEFYDNAKNMSFMEYSEKDREECMYSGWDPLVFDPWEEYLEINGLSEAEGNDEAKLTPLNELYDTYARYIEEYENFENMDIEEIKPIWESIVEISKKEFIRDCGAIYLPEVAGHIKEEFSDIFERYGLWYEYCFDWSLTSYSIFSKS